MTRLTLVSIILNLVIGRTTATLLYPAPFGAVGFITALAIPLELDEFNVFISYNYEANWGLPIMASHFRDAIWLNPKGEEDFIDETVQRSHKDESLLQSFVTRRKLYDSMLQRINQGRYPGKECLMRMICEHGSSSVAKYNGLVGDILNVILSPLSSKHEEGMDEFYEAERRGRDEGRCDEYSRICKISVLDLISKLDI